MDQDADRSHVRALAAGSPPVGSDRRLVGEGGQIAPLLGALVALCAASVLAVAAVGGHAVDVARIRTAADAAALAGAVGGRAAAAEVAAANGATLQAWIDHGSWVEVTVERGDVRGSAAAETAPVG